MRQYRKYARYLLIRYLVNAYNKCASGVCCGGSCSSNAGLQWAHYKNLYPRTESYWPNFDPTGFKNITGDYNSTTTYVGLNAPDQNAQISLYGSQQSFPANEFILNHRGYIYAEQSGNYTVSTTADDDIMIVWLGILAYSGWTRSNANLESAFPTLNTVTYTANLVQGQYYALRLMFGQAGGAAIESITITDPSGAVILGASSTANPSVIQYSCDGTTAPHYPLFGQET